MPFDRQDIVRVAQLVLETRDVDGSAAEPPQPRRGEIGVVVDDLGDDLYLVEHATDDGHTLWVAEFHADELELVQPASDAGA